MWKMKLLAVAIGLLLVSGAFLQMAPGAEAEASSMQKSGIDYKASESASVGGGSSYIDGITLSKNPDTEAWATYEFLFPTDSIHQLTAGVYMRDDSWFGQGPAFLAFNWQTSSWTTIANPIGKAVGYYSYSLDPGLYISAPSPFLKIRIHAGYFDCTDINHVRVDYSHDGLPSVLFTAPVGTGGTAVTAESSMIVSGTASDDFGVSSVEIRVNEGLWGIASGTTSWSRIVQLAPGTNTVYARARDTANQYSPVRHIHVTYEPLTGTIFVNTNLGAATFEITGPESYSGSGTSWCQEGAPAGTYTIAYGSVSGYISPATESMILEHGSSVAFMGEFMLAANNSEARMELRAGWNLISVPLAMDDTSVGGVLSSIAGMWDAAKHYDAAAGTWKTYRVGRQTNTLEHIDRTMGLWLHATEPCTLTVSGEVPESTSILLRSGWNLVGFPSATERTASSALWGTGADRVERFTPHSPFIVEMGHNELMSAGNGYWVRVAADVVWAVEW